MLTNCEQKSNNILWHTSWESTELSENKLAKFTEFKDKFSTSMPLRRSPPASCISCQQPDTDEMVQCDMCNKWVHFSCAGVDTSVEDNPFKCYRCSQPPPKTTKAKSVGSGKSSKVSKSSAYANLEIQRLQEELKIKEEQKKLELDFVKKKYDLLHTALSSSSKASCSSKAESNQKVLTWLGQNSVKPKPAGLEKQLTSNQQPMVSHGQEPQTQVPFQYFSQMPQTYQPNTEQQMSTGYPEMRHLLTRSLFSKDLPQFSGKAEEWPLFISSYRRTTQMCAITDDENMIRLQRALKGKALEAVQSRLLLPSSAADVIETLEMLFGNPEAIIYSLINRIRCEPAPKTEKLESIIQFSLSVQNLHATMEACNLIAHINNPMLVQELVEKLPPTLKLDWARYLQANVMLLNNISTLSKWLSELANAACKVTHSSTMTQQNTPKGAAQLARTGLLHLTTKITCLACGKEDHSIKKCNKFIELNLNDRWALIKTKNICGRCLGNHNFKRCNLAATCGIGDCQRKHHQLLHNFVNQDQKDSTKVVTTHSMPSIESKTNKILFRVLPVTLHSERASVNTLAFLDEGSSVTLIDDLLAKDLQLSGAAAPLCLKWTGETTKNESNSKRVSFTISNQCEVGKRYKIMNARTN